MHKIWDGEKVHAAVLELSEVIQKAEPDLQLAVSESGVVHPSSIAENIGLLRARVMSQQRSIYILMAAVDALLQERLQPVAQDAVEATLEELMVQAVAEFKKTIKETVEKRKEQASNILLPGVHVPPNIRGNNGGRNFGG